MTKLERIREASGFDERLTLVFEDGKTMKVHPTVIADMGLYAGLLLDDAALDQLAYTAGKASTKARAVRMVSASNLSQRELLRRLQQKGESEQNADEAVQWLAGLNILDDERTARQLARNAANKGYGKARIRQIFYQKGIPKELWDTVLADLPEPTDAIDRFVTSRLRGSTPDQKETKRLVDALQRRGHSWHDIQGALRRYTDALQGEWEEIES